MKKFKKILAVMLSLAMILGMSFTTFATNSKPDSTNTATATVKNVEPGATLKAYQIVKPTYNEYGFTGYERADGITETMLTNPLVPKAGEITAIAANKELLAKLTVVDSWTEGAKNEASDKKIVADYTASLGAGYWIVVVTGSDRQVVYNPMLVGIAYNKDGTGQLNALEDTEVSAYDRWTIEPLDDAYAKHSEPTITKTITPTDGNAHGNDVGDGGTVGFNIDTAIPAYSAEYTEVEVGVSDTLGEGLTLKQDSIVVNVGSEQNVKAGNSTYKLTTTEKGFQIDFVSDYALKHQEEAVVITYEATLAVVYGPVLDAEGNPVLDAEGNPVQEAKNVNFNPNTNKATLTYTNDPQNKDNKGKKDDRTYTYTFGIDTVLGGRDEYTTGELFKVDENTTKVDKLQTTKKVSNPLAGATFALTKAKLDEAGNPVQENGKYVKDGNVVKSNTSNAEGKIVLDGLDAGTYILEETEAPEDYSLEGKQHLVVISAQYNDDGTLKSYSIAIDGERTSTYTATYDKNNEGDVVEIIADHTGELESLIKNTKLVDLPSTGGIGTTIFTIGGCIIMVIAAGLFFASRRKSAK